MTNPTKLEELTKKIQELVPEIMEKTFGCNVNIEITPMRGIIKSVLLVDGQTLHGGVHDGVRVIKILGRDIQLADVLLAMNQKLSNIRKEQFTQQIYTNTYMVDCSGFFHRYSGVELELFDICWNFTKPLHHQSPETIDFLHSIFYGNL